jgi:hypothetical protein
MSRLDRSTSPIVLVMASLVLQGCATTTLAPGADKVRLTQKAADVASCTAVGNITTPPGPKGSGNFTTPASFQNQAVGLGGNTVFVTSQLLGAPIDGVVYRCPGGG